MIGLDSIRFSLFVIRYSFVVSDHGNGMTMTTRPDQMGSGGGTSRKEKEKNLPKFPSNTGLLQEERHSEVGDKNVHM